MSEHTTYGRLSPGRHPLQNSAPHHPDFADFDDEPAEIVPQPYRFGRDAPNDNHPPDDTMPMFLSEYEDELAAEDTPYDDLWPVRERRKSLTSRVLLAVVAAAAVAMLFALVTSDATRDLVASAKASIIGPTPDPTAPAQPPATQLTARDMQLNEPVRLPPLPAAAARPIQTASADPSREEIANAYQSALQTRPAVEPASKDPASTSVAPVVAIPAVAAPVVAVAAPIAPQQARRMDPDELAGLIKRAKGLLATGDIPPARLLLERAAEAQEPSAALMLAQTYDPKVLGTQDIRNITADPTVARTWYQRAAQLGSIEAQRRLGQLQN